MSSSGGLAARCVKARAAGRACNRLLGEGDDSAGPAGGQAEVSLAVDGTGQHVVIGFNDTRGFNLTPVSLSGFEYSDDGGQTFTDGGQLPAAPNTQVFGDPVVVFVPGSVCTFLYASIFINSSNIQTMSLHRSTDCGHTWAGPFEIPAATVSGGNADKEALAIDPTTGRLAIAWTEFTSTARQMSVALSDDAASAAPPTWSARDVVSTTTEDGQGMAAAFSGSSRLTVVWARFTSGGLTYEAAAQSTDNGLSFGAPTAASSAFLGMDQVLGNDRVHDFPSLAADRGSAYPGRLYLTYARNDNSDGADVAVQTSDDGGLTFSTPQLVNNSPGHDRAQWFPFVSVDASTGRARIHYYDQGVATSGDLTEVSSTYSDDGGSTWSRPTPLSDRPFHAGWGNDTGQPNLGDYIGSAAQNGAYFASWGGTTPPGFTDGLPSTSMTTPDVVATRVATTDSHLAVRLGDVSTGQDLHEGVATTLTIPLRNDITTAAAATLGGVSATLSSPTAGVTVTGASQTYADLAPGASGTSAAPFTVTLDPTFPDGTPVEFMLTVTSGGLTANLPFTVQTTSANSASLLTENFDGVSAGTLPNGWSSVHAAGSGTVPWTTSSTFCGATSNAAFHPNGTGTRWERLWSPSFTVPTSSSYVTVDMDVCYDTEDEPVFNVQAYDGFFLRLTDLTGGTAIRSVLAEAFQTEFTTGSAQGYPKHFPRSSNGSYFEDMSAWAGYSGGWVHVHMRLPGMAARTSQLRFEYTQDAIATCADVRPGHTCGVAIDNVDVRSYSNAALQSIDVTPADASVPNGTTQQYTATGHYSDGTTRDLTGSVTWSTGSTAVATISGAGLLTAVDTGSTSVTATLGASSGSTTVTVIAPVLQSIDVTPADASVPKGVTQQYTATGTYSDASTQDVTNSVTWSTGSSSVATISNAAGSQGLLTGVATGSTNVTATLGSVSGSTPVTVTSPVLESISVAPADALVPKGTTQQYTATGTYSDASTQDVTNSVTWSTGSSSVATISNAAGSQGLLTGVGLGSTSVSAIANGVSGSTTVTVTVPVLISLQVTPTSVSLRKGATYRLTATGTYSDGSTQNLTTTVTWSSSNNAVATVSNAAGSQGTVTALRKGKATITATYGGFSAHATVTVTRK